MIIYQIYVLSGSVQRSRRPDDIGLIEKWLYVRPPNVPFNVRKTNKITVGTYTDMWSFNKTNIHADTFITTSIMINKNKNNNFILIIKLWLIN